MDFVSRVGNVTSSPTAATAPSVPALGGAQARAGASPVASSSPGSMDSMVTLSSEAQEEGSSSLLDLAALGAQPEADPASKTGETEENKETTPEEKLTPEKQVELLKKQNEEAKVKLARQQAAGDEQGAKATQAEIGALSAQLDQLVTAQAQTGGNTTPTQGTTPVAGANNNAGGSAPASGGYASGGAAPAGGGYTGGSASGAGSTFGPSNAPAVSASALARTSPLGQKIAEAGKRNCNGTGGYCFRHVSRALAEVGIQTSGASAYMAADQLAKCDKLKEVKMDPKEFPNLPAGAVVVWDRGNGHEHGHISIADGSGGEYSDVYRKQTVNYGTTPRVFLPADMKTN